MENLEKTLAAAADLRKKVPMLSVYESIRVVQGQCFVDNAQTREDTTIAPLSESDEAAPTQLMGLGLLSEKIG